jgi:hypothetical protein
MTDAPSRAIATADARPIPWPAAVTSAVLPCSRPAIERETPRENGAFYALTSGSEQYVDLLL